jgi:drug/metabolite transporter (DMT)-like permease
MSRAQSSSSLSTPLREANSHIMRSNSSGMDSPSHSPAMFLVALGAIYLIWGSTYLAIRYAVETIPPFLMMGMRHIAAGSTLYAWTRLRGVPAPRLREWFYPVIVGTILFVGGHGTLAWAEETIPSGIAALLVATQPMFILLLSWGWGTEKAFTSRALAGVALGFAGVGVLFGPDMLHHSRALNLWGALAVLGGTFAWAVGTICMRKVKMPSSSILSSAMQMLAGGISLTVIGTFLGETRGFHFSQVTTRSWLATAYLAVFGSLVAFTAYTWLHTVERPSRVATYAYVNPVVAVLLGWAVGGETIGGFTVVAMVVILIGVALVNTGTKREPKYERIEPREGEVAAD